MKESRQKGTTKPLQNLRQKLQNFWKSRDIPFLYEKHGDMLVITGFKDSLLPKADFPAQIRGIPVKKIGARAFLQCDFLEELFFSDGIESIGANAFSSCERLTKIHMADSVHEIERNAFFECENLFCAELSNTLQILGARTFFGCTSLRDLALPDSLEKIGEQAFAGCSKLKSLRIPLALREFPRNSLDGCTALDSIFLERGCPADHILSQSEFFSQKLRYIPRI